MIVTVHALFSASNKIGAKVISLGSSHLAPSIKPSPSHTAVLVNNRWVHESTGHSGVSVLSYDIWETLHTEVGRIELEPRPYQEIANMYREIKGKKYDYLGVFFLGLCIVPTFLGFKLPKKNLWEAGDKYFCCEVLGYLTAEYYGMCSPVQIMAKLIKDQHG
jgi:hypothetical protein